MSSMTAKARRKARRRGARLGPMRASMPRAKAVSVEMTAPQATAPSVPWAIPRWTRAGTTRPPTAAVASRRARPGSRSSPRVRSWRTSSPTMKKKAAMRPSSTQPWRLSSTLNGPTAREAGVCQKSW